jgi:hypothetical protein
MSTIDNGGPAFPVSTSNTYTGHQDGPNTWQFPGATLRDYFAAKAIQGLACSDQTLWPPGADESDDPTDALFMARTAYMIADAMLEARSR